MYKKIALILLALFLIFILVKIYTQSNTSSDKMAVQISPTPKKTTTDNRKLQETKIKEWITKANHCEVKEDCSIRSFGCPFGCYSLINKNENLSSIENLVTKYNSETQSCMYKCTRSPSEEEVQCEQNICVIRK